MSAAADSTFSRETNRVGSDFLEQPHQFLARDGNGPVLLLQPVDRDVYLRRTLHQPCERDVLHRMMGAVAYSRRYANDVRHELVVGGAIFMEGADLLSQQVQEPREIDMVDMPSVHQFVHARILGAFR
ncbi:hypothetical protein WKW80_32605 [Variovorax humicola]|uniref:Uncharacterized protein n=1 Tax=Variovorax humicola TaxID=1769758 RepID=A0ABU8WB14_9BURK